MKGVNSLSLQDILTPGEQILSECKPFYATSRRIIRFDDRAPDEPMAEISYDQLTAVELMRKPGHRMMVLGTAAIVSALFLTAIGFIFITSIPVLIIGVALLVVGARGKLGYYQLHIRRTVQPTPRTPNPNLDTTVRTLMETFGLRTPDEEARWRLDYRKAGSFIETIRTVMGHLPEM